MKNLSNQELSAIQGGTNRQCLIDGALTGFAIAIGITTGGLAGGAIGLLGGLFAGNSNGCF